MEKDVIKVLWITPALWSLRDCDRYSQEEIVLEFSAIAGSGNLFECSALIDKNENIYATSVAEMSRSVCFFWKEELRYVLFWKWHEAEQRVEIWAVYDKMLNSAAEVKKLIKDKGWDSFLERRQT